MSPSIREDLRAGLRDTLVWPPLPTAIAWILFQATPLLVTIVLAVPGIIFSPPVAQPEIPRIALLYMAMAAALLIAVAWGLARRRRWAWLLGLALEIPATLGFALFCWLGLHPPADVARAVGLRPQSAPVDVIVIMLLSLMAFGPVLYGLVHPATRAAMGIGRVPPR